MTPPLSPVEPPASPTNAISPYALDPCVVPNLDDLITEDQTPVDRIFTEKQQRLFTEPLYSTWKGGSEARPFLALANVGWFFNFGEPPIMPDGLLSLDAKPAGDLMTKEGHSYFQWLIGKQPEVTLEIVSDLRGGEDDWKMQTYAQLGVIIYAIFDPESLLRKGVLRAFALVRGRYEPVDPSWLPEIGLGLKLWPGAFENEHQTWLRWCDRDGQVVQTGAERALASDEKIRESDEKIRRLTAQLLALGQQPDV